MFFLKINKNISLYLISMQFSLVSGSCLKYTTIYKYITRLLSSALLQSYHRQKHYCTVCCYVQLFLHPEHPVSPDVPVTRSHTPTQGSIGYCSTKRKLVVVVVVVSTNDDIHHTFFL